MRAVVCEAFGGPEVLALREVPEPPPPGAGEVQVRIRARGAQYVDVLMLAGKYQFRPEPPFIPGSEAVGDVVAIGPDVTRFKIGDRVMSRHRLGAFAELGNASAENCDSIPAGMSLEEAAVFRGAYSTAYHALLQRGRLKEGDRVLIHGAAGGIGIPAIQIAKLFDAEVIAIASTNYLLIKGIEAIGVRIGGLNEAHPEIAAANTKALVDLAAQGKLKPRIWRRFPLSEVAEAVQALIDRKVIGKVVLE